MRLSPAAETTSLCLALLLLIIPLASSAAAAPNTTAPPCAPAWCGDLNIASPFWLAGTHPPECGRQGFQVTCDNATAYFRNSLWTYRIQAIFYGFKNLRVTNVDLLNGTCNLQKFANASTVVKPFYISPQQNQELFFIYGCNLRAQQLPPSWAPVSCANGSFANVSIPNALFAWLSGEYGPNDSSMTLPGNCSVSMIPVMAYEGATGADYQRLMEGGFMLEYLTEDCEDCHCSDGVTWLVPWVSLLIRFFDAIDGLEQASDPATQDGISLPAALTIGPQARGAAGAEVVPRFRLIYDGIS